MDLDTVEAAEALLQRLSKSVGTASTRGAGVTAGRSVARHLFALSQMHDPNIPARLADMIQKSSPLAAFMIVQTLTEIAGRQTPPECVLPLRPGTRDRQQQQKCAAWWKQNVPKGGRPQNPLRSGRITSPGPSPSPSPSAATPAGWQPDADILKPLALAAHVARKMAGMLKQGSPGDPDALLQDIATAPTIQVSEPNRVGADLLTALQNVRQAVLRRIDIKGAGQTEASKIERRRWIRSAACLTALQGAVVEMDTITDLVYLLICGSGKDPRVVTALPAVLSERNQAVASADAVDRQLRESCYYSFVLWDALAKP
jgi:hypothetical protein